MKAVLVLLALGGALFAGCGGGAAAANQQAWATAVSSNTCEAYGAFLKDFPEGPQVADAQSRQRATCDDEDWEKARSANTQAAYKAYFDQHKGGAHVTEVRKELALRAVKRVALEVASRNCLEDSCPFIAIARKVLGNAGIEIAERSGANDVLLKVDSAVSLVNANRAEAVPYSTIDGTISVQAGRTTFIVRPFNGRAMGGWEVYDVHRTPRWPSTPTVFNAAPVEDTMTALVKDFFGR